MTIILLTPPEIIKHLATRVRARRLSLNLSQKSLAERSGVSLGALKLFEHTGKISLESLLKIALVLESLAEFMHLFDASQKEPHSLDEILEKKIRKRGRK